MKQVLCIFAWALLVQGQTPRFEAASVKPVDMGLRGRPARTIVGGPGTAQPGQIAYGEQSLKSLIFMAYAVQFYQLDTPTWADDEYFDVIGKIPAGSTKEDVRFMLQALLEERFKLKIHHESREVRGYAITAGKNGAKMKPSTPAAVPATPAVPGRSGPPHFDLDKDGFIVVPSDASTVMMVPSRDGISRVTGARQTMEELARYLSRLLQQPVVDQTGLKGTYDFHLWFVPEIATASPVSEPAPTLPRALETQLGLKMESRKVPVEILVIDHIERKPVEN